MRSPETLSVPFGCLHVPSRLEGIETKIASHCFFLLSYKICLHVPSRLEGIETPENTFAFVSSKIIFVYMCLPVWRELKHAQPRCQL